MSEQLRTRCVCGWEAVGPEDEVVEKTLDHGLRVHNMGGTREEVLQRAERIEPQAANAAPPAQTGPPADEVAIVDVPDRERFEARIGSAVVGFSQYRLRDGSIDLLHTEIDPDREGQGIGTKLAKGVLTDVLGRGLAVTVRCPFIAAYVRRHRADYPTMDFKTNQIPAAS
jgi:predicted GNAT family acetyltransferase